MAAVAQTKPARAVTRYFYYQGVFSCCLSASAILRLLIVGHTNLLLPSSVMMCFNLLSSICYLYWDRIFNISPQYPVETWTSKWSITTKIACLVCLNWILAISAVAIARH